MNPVVAAVRRFASDFRFEPRAVQSFRHYNGTLFGKDLVSGLTVGVVALPLAMAFAIASGLPPQAGIFTAIIAGLIVSLLGGTRVQIGGPAGAFIVIVYGIVERYGVANLIIATAMAGVLLFAMGAFRLGGLVRFIPIAVVIGFTNGIAVLIALSQVKDFLGIQVDKMPADFFAQIHTLWQHADTVNPHAVAVAAGSLLLIVLWQHASPTLAPRAQFQGKLSMVPGSVVALIAGTLVVSLMDLPVATIGSRFGEIPRHLPAFQLPDFSWATVKLLFIPTLTIALLGAIESLLCARVADGITGDRHDPNQELMAQGIANFVTPFFGGMPATGTIARTVTNIKSGAVSPMAGVVHALTLLVVILAAAPLAGKVPLATLAAVLLYVAWNMGEWHEFTRIRQFKLPYRIVLLGTFFLTVVFDLTVAVEMGLVVACLTFIYRISSLTRLEPVDPQIHRALSLHIGKITALRMYGALFFAAVHRLEELSEHLPEQALVLDIKNVLYIDTTGGDAIRSLFKACQKRSVRLILTGANGQPLDMLERTGLSQLIGRDNLAPDLASGIELAVTATT
jgi:SulP family sulfate permease